MDSSNAAARAIATLGIWVAVTILGVGTLVNGRFMDGGPVVFIMAILLGAAVTVTSSIWRSGNSGNREQAEKAKGLTKIDHVLNKLSDQEVEDLRARLTENADGEQVSLEELLDAREPRRN